MHSFSLTCLDEFKSEGLMYSVKDDGTYCKYCKLFAIGDRGALVQVPFCRWKMPEVNLELTFEVM